MSLSFIEILKLLFVVGFFLTVTPFVAFMTALGISMGWTVGKFRGLDFIEKKRNEGN